ncbi:hypothetical protein DICSQDRAFT_170976 [Dichomitus squalens LYAD-421 SS1]|nr:uncharacterized protein DICSQDRAFT_170976 [Dichomitus squalens LYAD-421 SS1]EJF60529.1 hypothetical protein DICSQDRAFT_170976 [Dichomitus squalens LYAD-421 SS1]
MQYKALFVFASFAALASAAPADVVDEVSPSDDVSLTTHFTTQTFTATRILENMLTTEPYITTISTETVWTVAHTVTSVVPTSSS